MINRFQFSPSLFSAIGYADTRPAENAISPNDPKNRRVEILILKNKYKNTYGPRNDLSLNLSKSQQDAIQKRRAKIIEQIEGDSLSPAAKQLLEENKKKIEKQKKEKLSKKNMELYVNISEPEKLNSEDDMPTVERKVIKLNSNIPEDEDFGI